MTSPTAGNLIGHTALVTGASRGIGEAIAITLAKNGAAVAILSRNLTALMSVKETIGRLGSNCFAVAADVAKESELEEAIARIASEFSPIDILVNNAGIYSTSSVREQSLDQWRLVIETNLTSAMRTSKAVLNPMIEEGWGRIVNISSISGKSGEAYGAAYSASKFALIGLTQSLALETARHGITVNAVCPGWVDTKMASDQLTDPDWLKLNGIALDESLTIARLSSPQNRFISPQEVADLVTFLCSDQARGITGQAINICGGMSIH